MRVALLQIASPDEESVEARRSRIDQMVLAETDLGTADLLVLPELWPVGAFNYRGFAGSAEPLDGPTLKIARTWAQGHDIHVHTGSFVEAAGHDLFNTSVLLDPAGEVVATYRKVHLFGHEADELTPGDDLGIAEISDTRLGFTTCYDLRFPELYRSIIDAGATLTVITSAWPEVRIDNWRLLSAARAVENQMYVVACNAVGTHQGTELAGASRVVDPWGAVIAEAGADEGFMYADIDADLPDQVRSSFPAVTNRRWGQAARW